MNNTTENDTIKAMAGARIMLRLLLNTRAGLPWRLLSQVIELDSTLETVLQIKLPSANAEDFAAIGHLGIEDALPEHGGQIVVES